MRLASRPASEAASKHRAAEPAHQHAFLHRDHQRTLAPRRGGSSPRSSGLTNRALITPKSTPSAAKPVGGLDARAQQRAAGDQHAVAAPAEHFGLAQFDAATAGRSTISAAALG